MFCRILNEIIKIFKNTYQKDERDDLCKKKKNVLSSQIKNN